MHEHDEPVNRGAADRPLSNGEIVAKYRANATLWTGPDRVATMEAAMLGLNDAPHAVTAFTAFCNG